MKSLFVTTLFLFSFINAELTHFERGVDLYSQRANESVGLKANKKFINQAIDQYLKAMKTPGGELEAGVYLLKCYYYKGKFVSDNNDTKKEIFSEGNSLGEQLINL